MRVRSAWIVLLLVACAVGDDLPITPPPLPPPPPPAQTFRFEIAPGAGDLIGMMLGSSLQLVPRMVGSAGDVLAVSGAVSYTSRAPALVSVNLSGRLTAVAMGSSTIEASTVQQGQTLTDTLAISVFCTDELTAQVTPANPVSLSVTGRFTPTISLTTCGGQITLTDPITWSALDETIVSVNPATGETLGLRAGVTLVIANRNGTLPVASIQVTVQ